DLLLLPDRLALGAFRDAGVSGVALGADLDRDVGMRDEVVEPVGRRRRAALRREDRDGVVGETLVGERIDALGAGLRTGVMEEQKRAPLEVPADPPVVGAELLDDLLIPVGHAVTVAAGVSSASRLFFQAYRAR